jgi:hypothetical protein
MLFGLLFFSFFGFLLLDDKICGDLGRSAANTILCGQAKRIGIRLDLRNIEPDEEGPFFQHDPTLRSAPPALSDPHFHQHYSISV